MITQGREGLQPLKTAARANPLFRRIRPESHHIDQKDRAENIPNTVRYRSLSPPRLRHRLLIQTPTPHPQTQTHTQVPFRIQQQQSHPKAPLPRNQPYNPVLLLRRCSRRTSSRTWMLERRRRSSSAATTTRLRCFVGLFIRL